MIVAPPALFRAYAGEDVDTRFPLRCVGGADELVRCLKSENVAAVVCHEAPSLDQGMLTALVAWYQGRRTGRPLLAVVTDFGEGREKNELHQCASLRFSRYHSRPQEIIAVLRQWAFPKRNSKLKIQ